MEFHPCGICGDHVLETDEAVQCDGQCSLWHHRECLGMTLAEYLKLSRGQEDWFCTKCVVKQEIKQEAQAERRRLQRSEMGKSKIECKKLEVLTGDQKCVFCQKTDIDEMKYGPIYMHKTIITHYYCLLLSSNMEQNGKDCDGILGFLANDIHKEVKRGVRLYCTYCRRGGATLGCAIAKCKVVFHLPCGMKHGTLHQFFGEFKSYCAKHRPVQKISAKILSESSKNAMCGICYEKVVPRPIHETLWAPCCQKSAFFHRDCVQKLATSAGYFFKCPLCNNTSTFQKEMKEYGIYIPEQDASWECVPNAYQDLLVRHDSCDSVSCSCPRGRKFNNQGTRWELVLCKFCGSQGMHIGCGRLKWKSPEFVCDICTGNNDTEEENPRNQGNRHRLSGAGRTAQVHPSVSADREIERSDDEESNDDSSDKSETVTVTNRRGRRRVVSPPAEPLLADTRLNIKLEKKRKQRSASTSDFKTEVISSREREDTPEKDETVVIEDSDDDVEVVGETKGGSCLKTNDGSTIPIIKVRDHVKKRLNIEGDVNVVPDEIITITDVRDGPPTKRNPSPNVQEVIYSLPPPMQKPSTSTFCQTPSSSFTAPVPDAAANLGPFVLVDPSTFRPEDLPPGTLLYRSFAPMVPVPQMTVPQQPQPQPAPNPQVPMQQLGGPDGGCADAKHPDLSKHGGGGSLHLNSPADDAKETSRSKQRNSSGRRGRRRCDNDRLIPVVQISPLKSRISERGFIEISLPRRNLGFGLGFAFGSLKRKAGPLQSKPAKKMKLSKDTAPKERSRNSSQHKQNKRDKTKKRTSKGKTEKKRKSKKTTIPNNERNVKKCNDTSQEEKVNIQCTSQITKSLLPEKLVKKNSSKSDQKKSKCKEFKPTIWKENSLSDQEIKKRKKLNKTKYFFKFDWKGKKISDYLKKTNNKQENQSDDTLVNPKLNNDMNSCSTVQDIMDELIGFAVEQHLSKDFSTSENSGNSDQSITSNDDDLNVGSCGNSNAFLEFCNSLMPNTRTEYPPITSQVEPCDIDANCENDKKVEVSLVNSKELKEVMDDGSIYNLPPSSQEDEYGGIGESRSAKEVVSETVEGTVALSPSASLQEVKQVVQENELSNSNNTRKDICAIKMFPKIKIKFKCHSIVQKNVFDTNSEKDEEDYFKARQFQDNILPSVGIKSCTGTEINSKIKGNIRVSFLPKAKRRKLDRVSPTSKVGTIQNYFTSVKKDYSSSSIKTPANHTSENNMNCERGKENDCISTSCVEMGNGILCGLITGPNLELDTKMGTPVKPAVNTFPGKIPLSELGIQHTNLKLN